MKTIPAIAYLVDRSGEVHGTLDLYDPEPKESLDSLNPNVHKMTDGLYQYTLVEPDSGDFLLHLERLFA